MMWYVIWYTTGLAIGHTNFGLGGGDKGPMQGGEWGVIRDKIKWTKKISVNLWLWAIFLFKPAQQFNILAIKTFK